MLGMGLVPSKTAHWLVAEKPLAQMLLSQKLRVKGRELAVPVGDRGLSELWQSSSCWDRLSSGSALRLGWSLPTLPEFCRRVLAKGYAQRQVQDEPPPRLQGGELGFELKPPALPARWRLGSRSPSRQHRSGLRQLEGSKLGGRNVLTQDCCSSVALPCSEPSKLMGTSRLNSGSAFSLFCR